MRAFGHRGNRSSFGKLAPLLGVISMIAIMFSGVVAPAAGAAPGSRIVWQGTPWYLHGANVPWLNWSCDFGCDANGGVSSAAANSALSGKFAQASSAGMHTIRWWTFEGSPWQITTDSTGAPSGINPAVYADFDAALALAQQYDLYFDFVLFNGAAELPAGWLNDSTQRQRLASVLGQLFAHYSGNPRVLSWEVFNEPDFDVWNGKVLQASMTSTVQAVAASVHANSTAYVTVGMGYADGLPMVVGTGLDYYQAHWYDYMNTGTYCLRCNNYAFYQSKFNLDAPLVVGEMYAGPDVDSYQRYTDFYNKGYAGAWAWSLSPEKTSDALAIDFSASQTFAGQHTDLGPRAGVTPPPTATSTATPVPPTATPTATAISTVTPTSTAVPTATATPTAGSSTVLLGSNTVQATDDSNSSGTAEAFQFTAASSGTANHIALYVNGNNGASQIVIGLYSNSNRHAGTLLASAIVNNPVAGAWNTVTIAPTTLKAGATYWIAVLGPSGGGVVHFRDKGTNGSRSQTSAQTSLTSLPTSWSAGTTYGSSPLSAYVTP